jgi:hypothetical protein
MIEKWLARKGASLRLKKNCLRASKSSKKRLRLSIVRRTLLVRAKPDCDKANYIRPACSRSRLSKPLVLTADLLLRL